MLNIRIALACAIFLMSISPFLVHHFFHDGVSNDNIIWNLPKDFEMPKGARIGKSVLTKTVRHINKTELLDIEYSLYNKSDLFNFDYDFSNVSLPSNIGESGQALLLHALRPRNVWDEEIDPAVEEERCNRYFTYHNYTQHFTAKYDKNRKRRRVFLGSLIADDSWHALGAIAMETYGIYTAVVFVESNRTQMETSRNFRFAKGTLEHDILVESNLFGPNTTVQVGQFVQEGAVKGGGLIREHMQRHMIFDLWKKAGMTENDVGILSDADETISRDFLRAVQICDIPQLDVEKQNCHSPKMVVASRVFEGSPECMTAIRKWMHPDLMLGKCIEGIGDDRYRLQPSERMMPYSFRRKKFSAKTNYSAWPKDKKLYPLWNPPDFRRDTGGLDIFMEDADYLQFRMGHSGYHFHNYFETLEQLRTKYMTYGHPVKSANEMSIGEIHPDLDLMVDCVLGRSTNNNTFSFVENVLNQFEGRLPIAYQLKGYAIARHFELRKILMDDEIGHNGTWHNSPENPDLKK